MGRGRLQDAAQLAEHGETAGRSPTRGVRETAGRSPTRGARETAGTQPNSRSTGDCRTQPRLAERIEQTNGLKLDTRKTEAL